MGPKKGPLKGNIFGQESTSTCIKENLKKNLWGMAVCKKLGVILESNVDQKLSLEKKKILKTVS